MTNRNPYIIYYTLIPTPGKMVFAIWIKSLPQLGHQVRLNVRIICIAITTAFRRGLEQTNLLPPCIITHWLAR